MTTRLELMQRKKELLKELAKREEALANEREEIRKYKARIRAAKKTRNEDLKRYGRAAKAVITDTGKVGLVVLKGIDKVATGGQFFEPPRKRGKKVKIVRRRKRRRY